MMNFSGKALFRQDTASFTTAWLQSRRNSVLYRPACSPDLSPTEDIWCIVKHKEDPGLLSSYIYPILDKNGTTFFSQASRNLSPQLPDIVRLLLIE